MVKKKRGRKKQKKVKISKKEPTEKELFEMKVEELRQEFETSVDRLRERSEDLSSARDLLERQVDSKMSCVSYLQRVLKREFQRRLAIQERLQTECDLAELMEVRALGKFAASDRSSEVTRSLFLQQKMELKGKLSLLEELRLERNSQRTHLRRAEDALEERASALRAKGREEDSNQADRLLCNRENFISMCNTTRAEWKSAFDLRLPVHARRQLKENVRLRSECEETTEYLLSEQGRNRELRTQQKAMDLEEEIQESADKYEARRLVRQEEKIRRMAQRQRDLNSREQNLSKDAGEQKEEFLDRIEKTLSFPLYFSTCVEPLAEGIVASKTESIRDREIEQCRLKDRFQEMTAIRGDQERYKTSLERKMKENADRNGIMMSAILRAGKIFQARCAKVAESDDLDFEVLQQIRLQLDLAGNGASQA